jgi:hypothetical protein
LEYFYKNLLYSSCIQYPALCITHYQYVIRADGEVFAARMEVARWDLQEQNRLLNALMDTYKGHRQVQRVMSEELEEMKDAGKLGAVRVAGCSR